MGSSCRPAAVSAIAERLGEDVGRLDGILATLAGTFGTSRPLTPAEVEPFLGEAGDVPPWELTDALDAGNTVSRARCAGADDGRRRRGIRSR